MPGPQKRLSGKLYKLKFRRNSVEHDHNKFPWKISHWIDWPCTGIYSLDRSGYSWLISPRKICFLCKSILLTLLCYYEKNYEKNLKFTTKKIFFFNFENMFLEYFFKVFNLQKTFSWYLSVFWKPRHGYPYLQVSFKYLDDQFL